MTYLINTCMGRILIPLFFFSYIFVFFYYLTSDINCIYKFFFQKDLNHDYNEIVFLLGVYGRLMSLRLTNMFFFVFNGIIIIHRICFMEFSLNIIAEIIKD